MTPSVEIGHSPRGPSRGCFDANPDRVVRAHWTAGPSRTRPAGECTCHLRQLRAREASAGRRPASVLIMNSSNSRGPRTRSVLLATGILVLGIAATGVAATGDVLREGTRNGTATKETSIVSSNPATTTATGGYATRQSNKSTTGGGAVYGCRSTTGGSAATPPTNPCLRANNLSTGFAFEFNAQNGASAGLITVGGGGDAKKPFTTNATGVATGLNADRVDGVEAAALKTRWLLVNEAGQIEEQSGGFTILDAYQTNQNVYIDPARRSPARA